jgi:hypothetical protein
VLLDLKYHFAEDGSRRLRPQKSDCVGRKQWRGRQHGNQLLRPRRITQGEQKLEKFAARVLDKSVFISYKRRDHRGDGRNDRLRRFVNALVARGYAVWFDRIALPGSRISDEARIPFDKEDQRAMLTTLLRNGLRNCQAVITISSLNYCQPSRSGGDNWTQEEFNSVARKPRGAAGPLDRAVWRLYDLPRNGMKFSEDEVFGQSRSPVRAAEDFDDWFRRRRKTRASRSRSFATWPEGQSER